MTNPLVGNRTRKPSAMGTLSHTTLEAWRHVTRASDDWHPDVTGSLRTCTGAGHEPRRSRRPGESDSSRRCVMSAWTMNAVWGDGCEPASGGPSKRHKSGGCSIGATRACAEPQTTHPLLQPMDV